MSKRKLDLRAGQPPTPEMLPVDPPMFTDREWKCVAWAIAVIPWIPSAWATEIKSIAKKLRTYLGDDAVSEKAKP